MLRWLHDKPSPDHPRHPNHDESQFRHRRRLTKYLTGGTECLANVTPVSRSWHNLKPLPKAKCLEMSLNRYVWLNVRALFEKRCGDHRLPHQQAVPILRLNRRLCYIAGDGRG